MYLVVLRHTTDDAPIRLFKTREEAVAWAEIADPEDTPDCLKNYCHSDPVNYCVIEFSDEGKPLSNSRVRVID